MEFEKELLNWFERPNIKNLNQNVRISVTLSLKLPYILIHALSYIYNFSVLVTKPTPCFALLCSKALSNTQIER